MQPPDPLRELALDFLAKAQGDLAFALAGVDRLRAAGWGIAFHCQQAVEKAIKGELSLHGLTPPKPQIAGGKHRAHPALTNLGGDLVAVLKGLAD